MKRVCRGHVSELLLSSLTSDTVIVKSKLRFDYMVRSPACYKLQNIRDGVLMTIQFASVFLAMLISTIPVSVVGIQLAMSVEPFWKPMQFSKLIHLCTSSLYAPANNHSVPLMGMLCGNNITSVVVAVDYVLKELQ